MCVRTYCILQTAHLSPKCHQLCLKFIMLCVCIFCIFYDCYKKSCLDDAEFMLCTIKFKYSRLAVAFPSEAFEGSPMQIFEIKKKITK